MTRAEENTRMAAKLYGCRRIARRLLGAEYAERVTPWREVIEAHMARHRMTNVLSSVLALSDKIYNDHDQIALVMLMAAAVEIIEQQPKGQPTV